MIFAKTTFSDIQIFAGIGKIDFEHSDACDNDWWEIQKLEKSKNHGSGFLLIRGGHILTLLAPYTQNLVAHFAA